MCHSVVMVTVDMSDNGILTVQNFSETNQDRKSFLANLCLILGCVLGSSLSFPLMRRAWLIFGKLALRLEI